MLAALAGFDGVVTRAILREQLQELFRYPADVALFHFSGHGTTNNLDGYLCTQDGSEHDEGIPMTEVLKLANASKTREVVIILDCCFSGSLGNPAVLESDKALLREGVSILTGSRNDQPSVETGGGGVFTSLVIDALDGGAANLRGLVSAPSIYTFVEAALGAWNQRPLFKANVSTALDLRRCAPPIDGAILRRLPELFPLPAEDFPLNPSFENTCPPAHSANEAIFEELQALNRVHLVVPVEAPHMYNAALNSKACKLTPSGRYYWRLAKDGRV